MQVAVGFSLLDTGLTVRTPRGRLYMQGLHVEETPQRMIEGS